MKKCGDSAENGAAQSTANQLFMPLEQKDENKKMILLKCSLLAPCTFWFHFLFIHFVPENENEFHWGRNVSC